MVAAYTVITFVDIADYIAYCQDGSKLPTGKLVASFYSVKAGYVVVQAV